MPSLATTEPQKQTSDTGLHHFFNSVEFSREENLHKRGQNVKSTTMERLLLFSEENFDDDDDEK